jgi:hypothetical protein
VCNLRLDLLVQQEPWPVLQLDVLANGTLDDSHRVLTLLRGIEDTASNQTADGSLARWNQLGHLGFTRSLNLTQNTHAEKDLGQTQLDVVVGLLEYENRGKKKGKKNPTHE